MTQQKEDLLLELYKIHAYIPNDFEGEPLTPFGNFCVGYEVAEKNIESLKCDVKVLETTVHVITDVIDKFVTTYNMSCEEDGKRNKELTKAVIELRKLLPKQYENTLVK